MLIHPNVCGNMITITQIKAARALLGWTQSDLAKAAGLSLPAINNIERSLVSPRKETLCAIETALFNGGVSFIDQSGVQLQPPQLDTRIIEGPEWLKDYDEFLFSNLHSSEDLLDLFSCDEEQWIIHGSTTNSRYYEHKEKIRFKERIIIPKKQHFVTNSRSVYRYYNDSAFGETSWQIFGSYVAHIIWLKQQVLLIRSPAIVQTQRALFNELWENSKPASDAQWKKMKKWQGTKGL